MDKLLMLGTSAISVEMIEYAKSQGVYTIVTDFFPPEKSKAKLIADESWSISTSDLSALEEKCRQEGVTAIACGISEFNQDMALELCERLNLPNYATKSAWQFNRNKASFKRICKEVDAPVATDYHLTDALSDEELDAIRFPVVVKPVDCWNSQGVSFCHNKEELVQAYRHVRTLSDNPDVIVEQLINGQLHGSTYAFADGEAVLIDNITGYAQPGEPPHFCSIITTINSDFGHYFDKMDDAAKRVLKHAGCKEGIAWVQYMHDTASNNDYLIEMGYRLTGPCIFIPLGQVTHFDAAQWLVDCALGRKHTVQDLPKGISWPLASCACSYMVWTNRTGTIAQLQGLDEIEKIPGIYVIRNNVSVGDSISAYSQVCKILFNAKDCNEMCETIDRINRMMKVLDCDGNDMMIHYTDFETLKTNYELSLSRN